jgi:hypothetical protein
MVSRRKASGYEFERKIDMAGESIKQLVQGLSDNLASESFRTTLARDPAAALQQAGINAAELPPEVMETLGELSAEEIELLAKLDSKLKVAAQDQPAGWLAFLLF